MIRLMLTALSSKDEIDPGHGLTPPWNAEAALTLETYDGVGDTIHPSVIDMGEQGWNGYRYWLADTPYANADNQLENPCVWAGDSPTDFVVPPGVINPLVDAPPRIDGVNSGFHSDTEIVHDPEQDRMIIYYRRQLFGPPREVFVYALTSTDGVTWTDHLVHQLPYAPTEDQHPTPKHEYLSPTVVRMGPGQWWMWVWGGWRDTAVRWEATNPLGPWINPTDVTLNGHGLLGWHGDVIHHNNRFYMVYSDNIHTEFWGATSYDGVNWTQSNPKVLMTRRTDRWDRNLYRPTITPDPERGDVFSMWYSAISPSSPGGHAIGYTRLPISEWN